MKTQFALMVESLNSTLTNELRSLAQSLETKLQNSETQFTASLLQTESLLDASLRNARQTAKDDSAVLDNRLKGLEQSTRADRAELLSQLCQAETRFDASLQNTVRIAKENIAAVGEQLKMLEQSKNADRDELSKQLGQMETRFDKSVQHSIETATEKITALDMTMKAENTRLQQELAHLKEQLYSDLEARANDLDESKVSREMMAEALIELGMKVKSGERIAELKLLTSKPKQ